MYLLPTDEDIAKLYDLFDPETRFLLAAGAAIDETTKDAMPYFDEMEDDIIAMRRDINGFKISPPRYMQYSRGSNTVNFKGWSFEYKRDEDEDKDFEKQLLNKPYVKSVSSWDEI